MEDIRQPLFSRNTKRSRFTWKHRKVPQGLFKFSVPSDAAAKENLASQDLVKEPELDNGSNIEDISQDNLICSWEDGRPVDCPTNQTFLPKLDETPGKVPLASIKRTLSEVPDPLKVVPGNISEVKKPFPKETAAEKNVAFAIESTPHSDRGNTAVRVQRLEDKFSEVINSVLDENSENKNEKTACDVSVSEFPFDSVVKNKKNDAAGKDLSFNKVAESHSLAVLKEKKTSFSCANVSEDNANQAFNVHLEKSLPEKIVPEFIRSKTSKYKSTFPKKKKPPIRVEIVATPCKDSRTWCKSDLNKPEPQQRKKKPRLSMENIVQEAFLWSGSLNNRQIKDLTDLEVAYTVIKNILDEYSKSDESMSKYIEEYGNYIENEVVRKLVHLESLESRNKEIRMLGIKNKRLNVKLNHQAGNETRRRSRKRHQEEQD